MRECKECERFPDVSVGDTVRRVSGCYGNTIYIVARLPRCAHKILVNIKTGNCWDSDSTWGRTSPKDWEKVEVCYKEVK